MSSVATNSTGTEIADLAAYARQVAGQAAKAGQALSTITGSQKNRWLLAAAAALRGRQAEVLAANARDVELAPGYGLNAAAIDRLTLTPFRLESLAKALEEIVALPDPVGEILDSSIRPNGLQVMRTGTVGCRLFYL